MVKRNGFSLLEVILAMAILATAIAVLGELARLGMRNARIARDLTQAQLLCESKLAEITAGIILPEPVHGAAFPPDGNSAAPTWFYSIDLVRIDEQGLMAVRVTVTQNLPRSDRPIEFSLVRWILDPGIEPSEVPELDETDSESEGGQINEVG